MFAVSLQTDVIHCMIGRNQVIAITIVSTCRLFIRHDTVDITASFQNLSIPHESHELPFIQLQGPTELIKLNSKTQIHGEIQTFLTIE